MRTPVLKLDNYEAYMNNRSIELPISSIRDAFVYDITYALDNAKGNVYFEGGKYHINKVTILPNMVVFHIEEEENVG